MATYSSYTPTSAIARAMFNFDDFGLSNYKFTGTVRVSVSDSFTAADYSSFGFYSGLYTAGSNEVAWTAQMVANLQDVLGIYSQFANIAFEWKGDYDTSPPGSDSTPNSMDVGQAALTDININWISRSDVGFAGISGANSDSLLGYPGAAGDIFLNRAALGFAGDYSLDLNTRARQVLEHELGHSLGLSHPHTAYNDGAPTITAEYAATKDLGFDKLGFRTATAADMYKEYFSIMSYDDQQSLLPGTSGVFHSHTPMILDVIALQQAYGEGGGTTGSGNDTITAGTAGYRTYFDKGGVDTIDMSIYSDGAYLHMGVSIVGAAHLVGVAMSSRDAANRMVLGGDPANLRWFYGEYEDANGGPNADVISGNSLDNVINSGGGNDSVDGGDGNDDLGGGTGNDNLYGGIGNDRFDWSVALRTGDDTMYGGVGDDTFVISGNDEVVEYSGEGVDTIWVDQSYSIASLLYVENLSLLGRSAANLTGNDSSFPNTLIGNAAANIIDGRAGNDVLDGGGDNDILVGGAGADLLLGGAGVDTVSMAGASNGVVVDLRGPATWDGADRDVLDSIENVIGSANADEIVGDAGDNVLEGGAGADTLDGGAGNDTLHGDAGNDTPVSYTHLTLPTIYSV